MQKKKSFLIGSNWSFFTIRAVSWPIWFERANVYTIFMLLKAFFKVVTTEGCYGTNVNLCRKLMRGNFCLSEGLQNMNAWQKSEWVSEWVKEWVSERTSESEWVRKRLNDWESVKAVPYSGVLNELFFGSNEFLPNKRIINGVGCGCLGRDIGSGAKWSPSLVNDVPR